MPCYEPVGVRKFFEERCAKGNRGGTKNFASNVEHAWIVGGPCDRGTAHCVANASACPWQGFALQSSQQRSNLGWRKYVWDESIPFVANGLEPMQDASGNGMQ